MKKYIGLTIFLIGTILASFWIAISSGKLNIENKKEKMENLSKKSNEGFKGNQLDKSNEANKSELKNIVENIEDINQENKLTTSNNLEKENDENKLGNIQIEYTKENTYNSGQTNITNYGENFNNNGNIYNSTGTNIENNITENKPSIIKEFIFIGLAQANLYTGDKYNDIFNIFELDNLPTYKVEGKEIYIKELNSIEYEDEKNIMEQLIQKIGGNIVQTNMFGNKQLFANPDLFYKKEVIMLVEYESKLYFVVLPYKLYQQYKKFLKEVLFVKS